MRASRQVYQILKMLRECKTILSRHLAANVLQLLKKRLPTLSMQQICQHKAIHAAGNCRRPLSCDPYMAQMPTLIHPSVPALEFLFFTSENRVVSGRMLANVSPTLWQISIARYTWTKVLPPSRRQTVHTATVLVRHKGVALFHSSLDLSLRATTLRARLVPVPKTLAPVPRTVAPTLYVVDATHLAPPAPTL